MALQEQKKGYILLHSAADKSQFGTGFMIKNKWKNSIIDFQPKSKRIASLTLRIKKKLYSIIQVHAPTTEHKIEEIEDFYAEIDTKVNKERLMFHGDRRLQCSNR